MATATVLKKCGKCGQSARYAPRVRHCRIRQHGNLSYWCYGPLTVVAAPATMATTSVRPQDIALKKLKRTEALISQTHAELAALAKSLVRKHARLRALSAHATRYAQAASRTDEQIEAERLARLGRAAKKAQAAKTRAIEVE